MRSPTTAAGRQRACSVSALSIVLSSSKTISMPESRLLSGRRWARNNLPSLFTVDHVYRPLLAPVDWSPPPHVSGRAW